MRTIQFTRQYVELILAGTKVSTIRKCSQYAKALVGEPIQLKNGYRNAPFAFGEITALDPFTMKSAISSVRDYWPDMSRETITSELLRLYGGPISEWPNRLIIVRFHLM
jgi:hypothetical protein